MQMPTSGELLSGIQEWVEIESKSSDRDDVNRMMDLVAGQFAEQGARVARIPGEDGFGDHLSISSKWGADEPGILVLCHLDTVHPKGTLQSNPFRVEGDRAFGPGTYDMKGGAHLAYAAYRTLAQAKQTTPLPIRYLYVADEEVGSRTSRRHIEAAARKAKYVLVTEPARDGGKIVTARNGSARYMINVEGRPAHSGTRHSDGRSAILEMSEQVVRLENMTDYGRELTFNVGRIEGGTTPNTVPQFCAAELDVRFATLADGVETHAFVSTLPAFNPDVTVSVTGQINRPPFPRTDANDKLFDVAKDLAADIGFVLEDTKTGGGSDGNFTAASVATLDGLGVDGAGAHTLDEYLLVSSLLPRFQLQLRLLQTLV
ncbi:MAG: M20 family metallopeptidase [Hyphomicrobiaceae bacterium]